MDDPETEMLSSKYYEPKEITGLLNTGKHLTSFHLNISSLMFHSEELSTLWNNRILLKTK